MSPRPKKLLSKRGIKGWEKKERGKKENTFKAVFSLSPSVHTVLPRVIPLYKYAHIQNMDKMHVLN